MKEKQLWTWTVVGLKGLLYVIALILFIPILLIWIFIGLIISFIPELSGFKED